MPGVGGGSTPTLTQVRNWDVTHLENAADYWRSIGGQWDKAFSDVYQGSLSPGGTAWTGPAAEAAEARSLADMRVVGDLADALRNAAQVADTGAGDLRNAQQGVLLEIRDAESAGLTVSESFSIGESNPFSAEARSPGRRETRQQFADEIGLRVTALSALDHEVASKVTAAIAPLGHISFSESPPTGDGSATVGGDKPRIQLVDQRWKLGPDQEPPVVPQPQPGFSDQYRDYLTEPPRPQGPATEAPLPSYQNPPPPHKSHDECVRDYKEDHSLGEAMVEGGFESAGKKAIWGALVGAGITPEAAGSGALPGAVLGFVGGFAQGVMEAPAKQAIKGAVECLDAE